MSKFSFSSLRVRLLSVVFLALIPAFALLIYSAWEHRVTATLNAREQALRLARQAVQQQRQLISQSRRLLGELVQRPEIDIRTPIPCSSFLASELKKHSNYTNFGLIALDGTIQCSAIPVKGIINVADRAYFRKAIETRDFSVGDYLIGRVTGKVAITFGQPLFTSGGKLEAVVFAALDLDWLNQIVSTSNKARGSVLTLIDRNGTILARSQDSEKWLGRTMQESPLVKAVLSHRHEGTVETVGLDGINRLYAFSPLQVSGNIAAYVAIGISTDVAYSHVRAIAFRNLIFLGLLAVLIFMVAWYAGYLFIVRQVHRLVDATNRVAAGDLSARVAIPDDKGEINQLASAFDEMTKAVERRESQLTRTNRALRTLSKCNDILVRATDETELLNQACRAIVENGGFQSAWIGYADNDQIKTLRVVAHSGYDPSYFESKKFSWADEDTAQEPAGLAIRSGRANVIRTARNPSKSCPSRDEKPVENGPASAISVPLINAGTPFGALTLYAAEGDAFDSAVEALLTELAADLSYGVSTLQTRAAHRESEERFRLLVASVQDYAIIMLDPTGRVASWNTGAERINGYRKEEIIGQHISCFFTPEDIQSGTPGEALGMAQAQGSFQCEGWRMRKDGSRFWAHVTMTAIRDEDGNLKGFSKVARDLTDRKKAEGEILRLNKELEQRVIERTAQLELANKELETFSYSVSHDLRAPLRSIAGFSDALLEDYAGQLDKQGKDYLSRVCAAAQRMAELIDDLLKLSRVSRGELRSETVNLSEIARNIAADLQRAQPERRVEFVIADGMSANADNGLIKAALENLLGNAWKFTGRRMDAKIEFGVSGDNGDRGYFVRDNGAGFDTAYAAKLFGAFQRLHDAAEFPGTGIGLATVQRIIHRHGGRIWADGKPNGGATFYFTLPN